jgi:hypothetical protein
MLHSETPAQNLFGKRAEELKATNTE